MAYIIENSNEPCSIQSKIDKKEVSYGIPENFFVNSFAIYSVTTKY